MPRKRVRLTKKRVRLNEQPELPIRRKRIRLSKRPVRLWHPSWEPEIKGWTLNYLRIHSWRCESNLSSFEDLVQDAYCLFLKLCNTYPRVVNPRHFMALYKTSLRNLITDKSRLYTLKRELIDEACPAQEALKLEHNYSFSPEKLYELISEFMSGPPEIQMLAEFLSDDKNLEALRKPQRKSKGQPRMNIDQRLSMLMGINVFPFRKYFQEMLFE